MPIERLRYVGLSHFEADECGALNQLLAAAPAAVPLCGQIAAMVSINDIADRPPRALADGESLVARPPHACSWLDTPHVPHGWDCGLLMETSTRHFLLRRPVHPGRGTATRPLTEADILGPSEAFRQPMDYYAHAPQTTATLLRLAQRSRVPWPACTAAPGAATAARCCATSPKRCPDRADQRRAER